MWLMCTQARPWRKTRRPPLSVSTVRRCSSRPGAVPSTSETNTLPPSLAEISSQGTAEDALPRHWGWETVERFIKTIFVVETTSNVEIPRQMKSKKTAHNVKGFKLKFLRDHPHWRTKFRHLDPTTAVEDSGEWPRRNCHGGGGHGGLTKFCVVVNSFCL